MSLEQKIIDFLAKVPNQSPLAIAKAIGFSKSKDVNPTLYKLLKQGRVAKQAEADGSKPTWSLATTPALPPLDEEILAKLADQPNMLSASSIAHLLFGEEATAKLVNPSLYSLAGKGLVIFKTPPGEKQPQWCLAGRILSFSTKTIVDL